MSAWSQAHSSRELLMGEAGCHRQAPSRPDRLQWYATVAAAARASYASHFAIWDDDGGFALCTGGLTLAHEPHPIHRRLHDL